MFCVQLGLRPRVLSLFFTIFPLLRNFFQQLLLAAVSFHNVSLLAYNDNFSKKLVFQSELTLERLANCSCRRSSNHLSGAASLLEARMESSNTHKLDRQTAQTCTITKVGTQSDLNGFYRVFGYNVIVPFTSNAVVRMDPL